MLKFLSAEDVHRIHDRILAEEPGRAGVHDERLEAVIGRVKSPGRADKTPQKSPHRGLF